MRCFLSKRLQVREKQRPKSTAPLRSTAHDNEKEAEREANASAQRLTSRQLSGSGSRADFGDSLPNETTSEVTRVLHSSGAPLFEKTRNEMEQYFGHDFSKVRIHTDEPASRAARAIDARAFAVGNHIAFGRGEFTPDSDSGRFLLAHELTHVTQQGSENVVRRQPAASSGATDAAAAATDTATPKETAAANLETYEARLPYMYKDTTDNVTIGVGHRLADAAAAQELAFETSAKEKATGDEIKDAFEAVQKAKKGMLAQKYESLTSLRLPNDVITQLLTADVDEFEALLKSRFPDYSSYPSDVQLGLLDMIFNLGQTGLTSKFPKFVKAVKAKKWTDAAAESNRPQLSAERNAYVKALFDNAE
jgi:GH24 family phage-related lysozyme (muramidase)